jgi:hypothetical protein
MNSMWFNVEHYHNTHSTQYRCTHYTLLSTARCFQSVCNSVTSWCVILFSTNTSPLVRPPVHFPPDPHQSPPPAAAGTFSWYADCIHLAYRQCKDQWRTLVNTAMDLRTPYKATNFLSYCQFFKRDLNPWSYCNYICIDVRFLCSWHDVVYKRADSRQTDFIESHMDPTPLEASPTTTSYFLVFHSQ